MAEKLIKSVLWLVGGTALGYGLLVTLSAEEEPIKRDYPGLEPRTETLKKKQQFMNVIQAAAQSKQPLYRLDKESIEKELKKQN